MTAHDMRWRHVTQKLGTFPATKKDIKRKTKNRNRKGHIRGISDEARCHIPKIPPTRLFPFLPPFPTFPLLAAGDSDSSPTTRSRRWCCWCRRRALISLSPCTISPFPSSSSSISGFIHSKERFAFGFVLFFFVVVVASSFRLF